MSWRDRDNWRQREDGASQPPPYHHQGQDYASGSYGDRNTYDNRNAYDYWGTNDPRSGYDSRNPYENRNAYDSGSSYGGRNPYDSRAGFDNKRPRVRDNRDFAPQQYSGYGDEGAGPSQRGRRERPPPHLKGRDLENPQGFSQGWSRTDEQFGSARESYGSDGEEIPPGGGLSRDDRDRQDQFYNLYVEAERCREEQGYQDELGGGFRDDYGECSYRGGEMFSQREILSDDEIPSDHETPAYGGTPLMDQVSPESKMVVNRNIGEYFNSQKQRFRQPSTKFKGANKQKPLLEVFVVGLPMRIKTWQLMKQIKNLGFNVQNVEQIEKLSLFKVSLGRTGNFRDIYNVNHLKGHVCRIATKEEFPQILSDHKMKTGTQDSFESGSKQEFIGVKASKYTWHRDQKKDDVKSLPGSSESNQPPEQDVINWDSVDLPEDLGKKSAASPSGNQVDAGESFSLEGSLSAEKFKISVRGVFRVYVSGLPLKTCTSKAVAAELKQLKFTVKKVEKLPQLSLFKLLVKPKGNYREIYGVDSLLGRPCKMIDIKEYSSLLKEEKKLKMEEQKEMLSERFANEQRFLENREMSGEEMESEHLESYEQQIRYTPSGKIRKPKMKTIDVLIGGIPMDRLNFVIAKRLRKLGFTVRNVAKKLNLSMFQVKIGMVGNYQDIYRLTDLLGYPCTVTDAHQLYASRSTY